MSWSTIPVPVKNNSTICVLRGSTLHFSKLGAKPRFRSLRKDPSVQLYNEQRPDASAIVLKWRALEETAALPEDVKILPGISYRMSSNFADTTSFKIELIDEKETGEIASLLRKECFEQAFYTVDEETIEFTGNIK